MLGCQDFCGYDDWTFQYVRKHFGSEALSLLWAKAIGGESQQHYIHAARKEGLRGLFDMWTKTGIDEQCDWTFTLDPNRNTLRWDMRACPSRGELLKNDMQADEDYCDHCIGWLAPLLRQVDVEVIAHEHNHAGQCWCEMRDASKPSESLEVPEDIRRDPRWNAGYIDRFQGDRKLPLLDSPGASADPCEVLTRWFSRWSNVVVLGRGPSAIEVREIREQDAVLVTDPTYTSGDVFAGDPAAVLMGDGPENLEQFAARFLATPPDRRPLLLHVYLPGAPLVSFGQYGLPRPVPILPQLFRHDLYRHRSHRPYPTSGVFLVMLACTLGKPICIAGIDFYGHPSGRVYASDNAASGHQWPARHDPEIDRQHVLSALKYGAGPGLEMTFPLCEVFKSEMQSGLLP
jgi:hypothetical protein